VGGLRLCERIMECKETRQLVGATEPDPLASLTLCTYPAVKLVDVEAVTLLSVWIHSMK